MILTVILPFHHEEKIIAQTLHSLQKCLTIPHEIFLICEDKNDPTLSVIEEIQTNDPAVHVLFNAYRPGIPGAIKTGLERSSGKYILFLVADDTGPIAIINPMLNVMDQGYDLVSGTRYAKGGKSTGGGHWARHISTWGNGLFCLLTSSKLSDPTCGIKMFRKEILQRIKLKADTDWTIAFELAVESQYYHFKVTELPLVSCNHINGGGSHFKILPRVLKYGQIFLWGVFKLWKK